MNKPYELCILIPQEHSLTFDGLVRQLQTKLDADQLTVESENSSRISVSAGQWKYHLDWEDDSDVLLESAEIAEIFAKEHPARSAIANCSRRVSGWGDPDPSMKFFNNYIFVREVLEAISGLFVFDPQGGDIIST